MRPLDEIFNNCHLQVFPVLISQGVIICPHQVIVKGSVGAFGRADGYSGKGQIGEGMGGDSGGYRGLMPCRIGRINEIAGHQKSNTNNKEPSKFSSCCLNNMGFNKG